MANIACASHILLKTQDQANKLKKRIENGENFAQLAKKFSTCPSAKKGGDLGEFKKGVMASAFDKAVFAKGSENKTCLGPVKTKYGFHLVQVMYKD